MKEEVLFGKTECEYRVYSGTNYKALWDSIIQDKRIKNKEDYFIKKFAETTTHELVHAEIMEVLMDLFTPKEEEIIDNMVENGRRNSR